MRQRLGTPRTSLACHGSAVIPAAVKIVAGSAFSSVSIARERISDKARRLSAGDQFGGNGVEELFIVGRRYVLVGDAGEAGVAVRGRVDGQGTGTGVITGGVTIPHGSKKYVDGPDAGLLHGLIRFLPDPEVLLALRSPGPRTLATFARHD